MNQVYGIYKKLSLSLVVTQNVSLLPVLAVPPHKYVGSKKEGSGSLKYYKAGFELMRVDEFVNSHGRATAYRPKSEYVLLLSMNRSTIGNGSNVIKVRNKVQMILPVSITSVRDGDHFYPDPGMSVDPTAFEYQTVTINVFTGVADMQVRVSEMKEYEEKPSDLIHALSGVLDPLFDNLDVAVRESSLRIWQSPLGTELMLGYIDKLLLKTGLYTSFADEARKILGERLIGATPTKETPIVSMGMEGDTVEWDSEEDMAADIKEAGGNVSLARAIRKNNLRMKFLWDECSYDRRVVELTRQEVENTTDMSKPNITMVMTDDEVGKWYEMSAGSEEIAELEFSTLSRYIKTNKEQI